MKGLGQGHPVLPGPDRLEPLWTGDLGMGVKGAIFVLEPGHARAYCA